MKYQVHLECQIGVVIDDIEADNEQDARNAAEKQVAEWSQDRLPEVWGEDFQATEVVPQYVDDNTTPTVLTQDDVDTIDRTVRKLVKKIGPDFADRDKLDEFIESVTFAIVHEVEQHDAI